MEIGKTELLKARLRHREINFYETLKKVVCQKVKYDMI